MSQNPYAQPGPQYADTTPADARTSILAVLSLISGVAGLIICCIPFIGLLGVLFGVPALFSISAARGRKKGSGMAITGIVTGLIGAAIGTAMYFGANMLAREGAEMAVVFEHVEAGDLEATQDEFAPGVRDKVTAARLAEFRGAYHAEVGAYQGVPRGLGAWATAYGGAGQKAGERMGEMDEYEAVFPIPANFDSAPAFSLLALDTGGSGRPELLNIGVLVQDTGDVIWLLPPPAESAPAPQDPTEIPPDDEAPPDGGEGGG